MTREPPQQPPMGKIDAIDVGAKKLTVQTEFFGRPDWKIETKVYLGGALKKVYSDDLEGVTEEGLQRRITEFHNARLDEIAEGLSKRK